MSATVEDGRVTQTGTVDDIVSRPQSEYIAELVGLNYYRGRAHGDRVAIGDAAITTGAADDLKRVEPPLRSVPGPTP